MVKEDTHKSVVYETIIGYSYELLLVKNVPSVQHSEIKSYFITNN